MKTDLIVHCCGCQKDVSPRLTDGREIGKWVKKAHEATSMDWQHGGAKVVCLLPARTDTKWWHDYVIPHGKIDFIRGRLKFGGHKNSAPFPSAIVIFEPQPSKS